MEGIFVPKIAGYRSGMRYRTNPDGSVTEIPPEVLECGHPCGPGLVTVGYDWRPADESGESKRCRLYRCRQCGAITWQP